jgi:hypothetical protein
LAPFLAACDYRPTAATLRSCQPIAQASPVVGTIPFTGTIPIGAAITVSITTQPACPTPVVRNDAPNVLQVDSVSVSSVLITGLAIGTGRVRFVSGLDGLTWTAISVTVTP